VKKASTECVDLDLVSSRRDCRWSVVDFMCSCAVHSSGILHDLDIGFYISLW